MASNGGPVAPANDFDLNDLYKQLKDLDSMQESIAWRAIDIRQSRRPPYDFNEDGNFTRGDTKMHLDRTLEVLKDQSKLLETLKPLLEELRGSIRKAVNVSSRPSIRPLHILDLPDEILSQIFLHVKGFHQHRWAFFEYSDSHVKDIRLTCRRFCDASSHLLVHFLRVEMTRESLARFREISRHPTIRKGVQAVRVYTHFYSPKMANNIRIFGQYHIEKLNETTGHFESGIEQKMYDNPKFEARAREAVRKMRELILPWQDLLYLDWPGITASGYAKLRQRADEEKSGHLKVLLKAHECYRQRFSYQQIAIKSGSFIASVSSAMARMPVANRLELHDREPPFSIPRRKPTYFEQAEDHEALIKHITNPVEWEEAWLSNLGTPPAKIFLQLPAAIHKAGGMITSLSIKLTPPEDYSIFALSKDSQRDLSIAMQRLKEFEFHPESVSGSRVVPVREEDEIKNLVDFLIAVIDTNTLGRLDLWCHFLWENERVPHSNLGPIISLRPWKNLDTINLHAFPLRLENLKQFVHNLQKAPSYMSLSDCHLLSGTWAEALDVLRRKTKHISFSDPKGAECDDMTHAEKKAIFESKGKRTMDTSLAEDYLRGRIPNNPLRN